MKRAFTAFDKLVGWISAAAALVAAALLLGIFLIVQYEVVLRFVFNSPTSWSHEVSTFAICWVGFLAAGYVLRLGRHLEVDIVISRLSIRGRRVLGTITDAIAGAFCIYAVYLGVNFVQIAHMMQATSASEIDTPLWIPYLAIPIGFGIFALELGARILSRWDLVEHRDADFRPVIAE